MSGKRQSGRLVSERNYLSLVAVYNFDIEVVDSARVVALELREMLEENKLLNNGETKKEDKFFVSDYTAYFEKIARMFFEGGEINLKVADIWS